MTRQLILRIKWGLIFNPDFKYRYDAKMEILSNILKNWTFIFHLTPNFLFLHFEIFGARMTLAWKCPSLKSLHTLFGKYLHMLVKFEQFIV